MAEERKTNILNPGEVFVLLAVIAISFWVSQVNFLLFHTTVELFSIIVGVLIFVLSYTNRKYVRSDYFLFLGNAFTFIALLDFLHTLAYKGMNIFPGISADVPTQLWIAARYIEALSILISPIFIKRKVNRRLLFLAYFAVTTLIVLSIFVWRIFPVCYIEGSGLTAFKKTSEYIISLILIAASFVVWQNRKIFDRNILSYLLLALFSTVVSELFFTFYVSVFGISNVLGHIFKFVAFYFFYKAFVKELLENPMENIFFSLEMENRNFKDYLEYAGVIFLVLDIDGKVVLINKKGRELLGLPKDEILGKDWFREFLPENSRNQTRKVFLEALQGKVPLNSYFENPVVTKNGMRVLRWQNTLLKNASGDIAGILSSAEDITEEIQMKEQLVKLATIDGLTQVFNKQKGIEMLNNAIINIVGKEKLTICFVDANGLKSINDNYGHTEGDEYLKTVAKVLSGRVSAPSFLFRFGGDEFVIVLNGMDIDQSTEVMAGIDSELNEFNEANAKPYKISISYGFAVFDPEKPVSLVELLSIADKAMYKEKDKFYENLRKRNQFKDWS
ncbi:MAG: MASE3 domain-containing protein [Caldisericaceae bacterium]